MRTKTYTVQAQTEDIDFDLASTKTFFYRRSAEKYALKFNEQGKAITITTWDMINGDLQKIEVEHYN